MAKILLGKKEEFPPGTLREIKVDKRKYLVANVNGSLHAVDAACSHCAGKLVDRKLEGHKVSCPMHGAEFDVRTGKNLKKPKMMFAKGEDLQSYKVSIDGDDVVVEH